MHRHWFRRKRNWSTLCVDGWMLAAVPFIILWRAVTSATWRNWQTYFPIAFRPADVGLDVLRRDWLCRHQALAGSECIGGIHSKERKRKTEKSLTQNNPCITSSSDEVDAFCAHSDAERSALQRCWYTSPANTTWENLGSRTISPFLRGKRTEV